jgi:dephospho-CoA kinase
MKNIAIFGHMYSGKSTLSQALVDLGYQRVSFAGPLKEIAARVYGEPIEKSKEYEVARPSGEKETISGRQVLQEVGQSIKSHNRDFWLRWFFNDAGLYGTTPLVVDDGRFLFEYDALRDAGWFTVYVDTPFEIRMKRAKESLGRLPTAPEIHHESEIELPTIGLSCQYVAFGDSSAYEQAREIISESGGVTQWLMQ